MKNQSLTKTGLILLHLLFFNLGISFASGDIRGYVRDSLTKQPLVFVTVVLEAGSLQKVAQTDDEGQYIIKPLDAGNYTLKISYVGYQTVLYQNILISEGKTKYFDVDLTATTKSLITVVIRATPKEPIINILGPVTSIGAGQLEKMANSKQLKDVIATVPGVTQSDNGGALYFRGSRDGASSFYIDGERMMNDNIDVTGSAVADMTVYTGGIPAQYGDCTGGVVVITTKSYSTEMMRRRIKYSEE